MIGWVAGGQALRRCILVADVFSVLVCRAGIVNLTRLWQTGQHENQKPSYQRHRFPSEIISHAVWLSHRFCLSFREVEELLAERGITVTYETVRQWCRKFTLARVFFSNSRSTVFDVTRTHTESLLSRPPPHAGGPLSTVAPPGVSGLGGSGVRISSLA